MEDEDEITIFTFDLPMYMYPHQISGIRTGYYGLNKLLSGWQNDEYVIVGYINKEDANEFIGNNASAAYRFEHRTAVIAPNKDTTYSIVNSKGTIVLKDCNSIFELRKKIRHLVRYDEIKAVFIDDITALTTNGAKLYTYKNEIECISHTLYGLSREIRIPVVSLIPIKTSEINPRFRDPNRIGDIEKDADVVIWLTRDESGNLTPVVAKNRSGGVGDGYNNNSSNSEIPDESNEVPF